MSKKNTKVLTREEIDFIRKNSGKMTPNEIAAHLKRDPRSIRKYAAMYSDTAEVNEVNVAERRRLIMKALKEESFWGMLQGQLSDKELKYFADQWFHNILQFEQTSPLLHSERMQVVELIRNQIIMDRTLERQKSNLTEITRISEQIAAEQKKPDKDTELIRLLYDERNLLETAQGQYTKELKDIQTFINQIRKDLKGTRDQRVKNIADSKTDYATKIQLLEEEETAYREGREMILFRLAMEKERQNLYKLHEFLDGEMDYPLLTPELVDQLKRENQIDKQDG